MPATSQEPSGRIALRSGFQAGGSGRRKRVSARHQVKRLDRLSRSSPGNPVRQKKLVFFVQCGSVVRNFIGWRSRQVKSAPDVFADALVRKASAGAAWQSDSRIIHIRFAIHAICHPRLLRRRHCCAAAAPGTPVPMVIIWRNRRVNRIPLSVDNPRRTGTSSISWLPAPIPHSPSIHRDT